MIEKKKITDDIFPLLNILLYIGTYTRPFTEFEDEIKNATLIRVEVKCFAWERVPLRAFCNNL